MMFSPLPHLLSLLLPTQTHAGISESAATQPATAQLDDQAIQNIEAGLNQGRDASHPLQEPSQWFSSWQDISWLQGHPWLQTLIALAVLLLAACIIHLVAKWIMVKVVKTLFQRTATWWDDILLEHRVFHRIELLIPVIVFERGLALVPHLSDGFRLMATRVTMAIIVILLVMSFSGLLSAINAIYMRYPIARGRPIKGYLQVVNILVFIAGGIMIITALMGLEPFWFVSGIGAMMAVILLIFRDTLLSLVAGIQLVNNDLIRMDDWIEMPQFNADGFVRDISLNVVKVENWDKTTSVIPTHQFLSHSFKNWRGMFESGGRRIKRSVYLDMSTIRFLSAEEIARFSRYTRLKEYIQNKSNEIAAYNREHCPADACDIIANARHLTNVGTFRAYVMQYMQTHPEINQEMTLLVRQLAPTPQGLPLEIYAFTKDVRWAFHEAVQGDIFDHMLSIAPEFGLRVFQQPAGSDVASFIKAGQDDLIQSQPASRPPTLGLEDKAGS